MRNCGRCHTCGTPLRLVLDGEEWCETCEVYRRYRSHGWARAAAESAEEQCPPRDGGGQQERTAARPGPKL